MEIREVNREATERIERAEMLHDEVDEHRERAKRLETAVAEWRSLSIQGEGVRQTLEAAQDLTVSTDRRLANIRNERVALLAENQEISDKCQEVLRQAKDATSRLPEVMGDLSHFEFLYDNDLYQQMANGLDTHVAELRGQVAGLDVVRQALELIDV